MHPPKLVWLSGAAGGGVDYRYATNPEGCGPDGPSPGDAGMTTYHVRAGDTVIVDPEPVSRRRPRLPSPAAGSRSRTSPSAAAVWRS
jgi:hypothetical protein